MYHIFINIFIFSFFVCLFTFQCKIKILVVNDCAMDLSISLLNFYWPFELLPELCIYICCINCNANSYYQRTCHPERIDNFDKVKFWWNVATIQILRFHRNLQKKHSVNILSSIRSTKFDLHNSSKYRNIFGISESYECAISLV